MKAAIQDQLAELAQIGRLLARRPDITVVEGDQGWSFNCRTGVISMDRRRLRKESASFNRGLLCHEAAHGALTRLTPFLREIYFRRRDVYAVLNALEDCRIEAWLLETFPGCRPNIEEYNGKLIGETVGGRSAPPADRPLIAVLPWLIVSSWWHGREHLALPPEWRKVQDEIWPAIEAVTQFLPRARLPAAEVRQRYVASGTSLLFLAEDCRQAPDVWEQEVRLCQAQAWEVFVRIILPVVRRLAPESREMDPRLRREWLQAWLYEHTGPAAGRRRLPRGFRGRRIHPMARQDDPSLATDLASYENHVARQKHVIGLVSDELLRCLQPELRRKWRGPMGSGTRLCLRSVVRAEGDPRLKGQVWRTMSKESRPDPLFVLLIDRSGSMRGERIESTAAATALLAEVCARCGFGLSVFAFGNRCEPVVEWHEPLTDNARARLGGLPRCAGGGTELAPALRTVRRHLDEAPFAERCLVVISDGQVSEESEVRAELKTLAAEGVRLIGLGLGEDTEPLRDLIPGAQVRLKPEQLPALFVRLMRQAVPQR